MNLIVDIVQEVFQIIFLGKLDSELIHKSCVRTYYESYANKIFVTLIKFSDKFSEKSYVRKLYVVCKVMLKNIV